MCAAVPDLPENDEYKRTFSVLFRNPIHAAETARQKRRQAMKDFAGRTAFVTGGAHGVGIGLVRALLAQGCNVAIADIRPASIEAALKALDNPQGDGRAGGRVLAAGAGARRGCGGGEVRPVSLLFNNAGVNLFQTIEESSYDDWDWIMGVNLHGPINGVMTFVPRMIRAGKGGYVVNTASMAGFLAGRRLRHLQHHQVRGARACPHRCGPASAPHGIGVSVLCPGLVKSYIYASDEVRPAGLKAGAKPVDTEAVKRLAAVHEFGMEPDVIAARVLEAMREDRFHIFSHPEFKDELERGVHRDSRGLPRLPGRSGLHSQRIDFEKTRRASYRQQRRGLKAPMSVRGRGPRSREHHHGRCRGQRALLRGAARTGAARRPAAAHARQCALDVRRGRPRRAAHQQPGLSAHLRPRGTPGSDRRAAPRGAAMLAATRKCGRGSTSRGLEHQLNEVTAVSLRQIFVLDPNGGAAGAEFLRRLSERRALQALPWERQPCL